MTGWNEAPVIFECNGDQLVAILHRTNDPGVRPGVLIVVGGPQYRVGSHRQFALMARYLASAGYPVMRFDFSGMGDSEGLPRSFESVGDELRAAVQVFEAALEHAKPKIVLFGLCDAASVILMHAHELDSVRAIAIANPWVRTEAGEARSYVRHYYFQRLRQPAFWAKLLKGEVRVFRSALGFLQKLRRTAAADRSTQGFIARMLRGIQQFAGPILVLCSGRDLTAGEFEDLCRADRAWQQAMTRPGVELIRLPQADHTFSRREDLMESLAKLTSWLSGVSGQTPCR